MNKKLQENLDIIFAFAEKDSAVGFLEPNSWDSIRETSINKSKKIILAEIKKLEDK